MFKRIAPYLFAILMAAISAPQARSQGETQAVLDAIDRADALDTQGKFKEALDAYRDADRISNHTCPDCYLGMVNMECQLGDIAGALDDAKRAELVAGTDRMVAAQACEVRARLLMATSSSPDDPKVGEAETELRRAISLDPKKSIARFELGMLLLQENRDSEGVAEMKAFVSGPLASPRYVDRANRIIADPSRARVLPSEDFSLATLDGATISKAALRGKVVLLDFWASWCPPCRESLPAIAELHRKFAGRAFELVGISSDSDEEVWKDFVASNHMNWPETIDLDGQIQRLFDVPGFPTYVVLDRDGDIAFRETGFGSDSEKDIEAAINRALAKPFSAQPPTTSAAVSPAATPPVPAHVPAAPPAAAQPHVVVKFNYPPEDVQNSDVSVGVYRNDFLGLSCRVPAGWIPAEPEMIEQLNRGKMRRIERDEQERTRTEPLPDNSVEISFPQIVFHAGPGPRSDPPFVEITVEQGSSLTLESARHEADALQQQGLTILAPPREFTIGSHKFYRTDIESAQADSPVWKIFVETLVAQRYLVTLDIQATSKKELDGLATIVQSLSVSKP
jgi:thiol-disulfide isomerase/thioredoxin